MADHPRFRLYSRDGCHLCEDMLAGLRALPCAAGFEIDVVDVDEEPDARTRYGHKIPVLLFAGDLICCGRLDPEEVRKTIALHG
jgi:predicted thioredoxin/glutaredoxin